MTGDGWGGDFARWGLGGAGVLALHVAAGYWLVEASQRGEVHGVPDPIVLEMVIETMPEGPGPEAAEPEESAESEPAPEPEAEPEPEPEPEPLPDFTPPDFAELPPVEDFSDLIPEPLPVPDFEPPPLTELPPITDFSELVPDSALVLSASERPRARPERREPEPEPQRQEPRREEPRQEQPRQPPAQAQQARPQPQAQPSRNAGGASSQRQGNPAASRQQQASWQSQVGQRITRHMSRTRVGGRGGQVRVQVSVTIGANGAASARLASSTGNPQVDAALSRQAARLPGMPAPPNGQSVSFVQPIVVNLR